jgi:hypothetical protein
MSGDARNDPAKRMPGCEGGQWCRCEVSTPCRRVIGPSGVTEFEAACDLVRETSIMITLLDTHRDTPKDHRLLQEVADRYDRIHRSAGRNRRPQ